VRSGDSLERGHDAPIYSRPASWPIGLSGNPRPGLRTPRLPTMQSFWRKQLSPTVSEEGPRRLAHIPGQHPVLLGIRKSRGDHTLACAPPDTPEHKNPDDNTSDRQNRGAASPCINTRPSHTMANLAPARAYWGERFSLIQVNIATFTS
jgi:hypothetical protein